MFNLQDFFVVGVWFVGIECGEFVVDYYGDDIVFVYVVGIVGVDVLVVVDYVDCIGDCFDFIEFM